ncbi:MAG: tetratricopeptide repeat protein [Isosphaeraceae bacterium]
MVEAVAIENALAEDHPGAPSYEGNLAKSLGNLANFYSRTGRPEQAERTHIRALKLFESLGARFPDVIDYTHSVALTRLNVALDHEGQGDPEGALEWLDRADQALAGLRSRAPSFARGLETEGLSAGFRAQILDRLGRTDEALASLDRADALMPKGSERESLRSRRALILAHRGEFDLAIGLTPGSPTPISQVAYDWARAWSLAAKAAADPAEADRRGRQAVAFLARARDLGFFKLPATRAMLAQEPDLEPIRSRDDFPSVDP